MDFLEGEGKETDEKELNFIAEAIEKNVRFDNDDIDTKAADKGHKHIAETKDIASKNHPDDELDSKADSKDSHQHTTHKAKNKARDMKIDDEDDDGISVNSEITY